MNTPLVAAILEKYQLTPHTIHPSTHGYRNTVIPVTLTSGQKVVVLIYKREPGIANTINRIHQVLTFLKPTLPVPQPIPHPQKILRINTVQRYAAIYTHLPGNTIPWEAYSQKHLKILGKTMSDLHHYLANFHPSPPLPSAISRLRQQQQTMINYFDDHVLQAMQQKLRLTLKPQSLICQLPLTPSDQALHLDFVRSNILFSTQHRWPEITGILDFEKIAAGPPIIDLARTLAFLLVDCASKTPTQVYKYFLHSGYIKRGLNKLNSTTGLQELVIHFLLFDFYKFLKHNPYESLHLNHHFRRTSSILLFKQILQIKLAI